jgi:hypothetical protein
MIMVREGLSESAPHIEGKPNTDTRGLSSYATTHEETDTSTIEKVTDQFYNFVAKSRVFCDKSAFIQKVLDHRKAVIALAFPCRWGKTMCMRMLVFFLGIELNPQHELKHPKDTLAYQLFVEGRVFFPSSESDAEPLIGERKIAPLQISKSKAKLAHMARYPVIFCSFQGMYFVDYEDFIVQLKKIICKIYNEFPYLSSSSKLNRIDKKIFGVYSSPFEMDRWNAENALDGLKYLSRFLFKHFGKHVVILIDACDAPAAHNQKSRDDKETEAIQVFMKSFLEISLTNKFVFKAVVAGECCEGVKELISDNLYDSTAVQSPQEGDMRDCFGLYEEEINAILPSHLPPHNLEEALAFHYGNHDMEACQQLVNNIQI